jgi:hypothetical protein
MRQRSSVEGVSTHLSVLLCLGLPVPVLVSVSALVLMSAPVSTSECHLM